jgi:hypothetical protein
VRGRQKRSIYAMGANEVITHGRHRAISRGGNSHPRFGALGQIGRGSRLSGHRRVESRHGVQDVLVSDNSDNLVVGEGLLSINNNVSARSLRAQVIGRKKYRFVGSARAGRKATALYSWVESCKRHEVDPFAN